MEAGGLNIDVSGTGHTVAGRDIIISQPISDPAQNQDRHELSMLLDKVKTIWIDKYLKESIKGAPIIKISFIIGKNQTIQSEGAIMHKMPAPQTDLDIERIYCNQGKSLLLLGDPGAGKTIAALQLVEKLLETAQKDIYKGVPVVFKLSSWRNDSHDLLGWLTSEFFKFYRIPKSQSSQWLITRRVLVILDGLDEIKDINRKSCVDAINKYMEDVGVSGIIITSRLQEYQNLNYKLKLEVAIILEDLTNNQIDQYVAFVEGGAVNLAQSFNNDSVLKQLARTPLFLNILCYAYRGVIVNAWENSLSESSEKRLENLFETYVKQMLIRNNSIISSNAGFVKRLSWLARQMEERSISVFWVEQIQPSWLNKKGNFIFYILISRFIEVNLFTKAILIFDSSYYQKFLVVFIYSTKLWIFVLLLDITMLLTKSKEKTKHVTVTKKYFLLFLYVSSFTFLSIHSDFIFSKLDAILPERLSDSTLGMNNVVYEIFISLFQILFMVFHYLTNSDIMSDDIGLGRSLNFNLKRAIREYFGLYFILTVLYFLLEIDFFDKPMISILAIASKLELLDEKLLYALIGFIHGGFFVKKATNKTEVSYNLKSSIKKSCIIFFLGSFIVFLTYFYYYNGVYLISIISILFWFMFGGLSLIRYLIVYLILIAEGSIVLSYTGFLNHSSKLMFLRNVGRGYIFIHPTLQKYFSYLKNLNLPKD